MRIHVVSGEPDRSMCGTFVIVDVFRSSSAITAALRNGARSVIPFSGLRAALEARRTARNPSEMLLAGERRGITPKGFDCNISPFEMTSENVRGKVIVYSSSNLTRILGKVKGRSKVVIGCINNARAVADYLARDGKDVVIIACGTVEGRAIEDFAGAGAIVDSLPLKDLSDDALMAVGFYRNPHWQDLARAGRIAKLLPHLGYEKDIDYCLAPNTNPIVPGLVGNKIVGLNEV